MKKIIKNFLISLFLIILLASYLSENKSIAYVNDKLISRGGWVSKGEGPAYAWNVTWWDYDGNKTYATEGKWFDYVMPTLKKDSITSFAFLSYEDVFEHKEAYVSVSRDRTFYKGEIFDENGKDIADRAEYGYSGDYYSPWNFVPNIVCMHTFASDLHGVHDGKYKSAGNIEISADGSIKVYDGKNKGGIEIPMTDDLRYYGKYVARLAYEMQNNPALETFGTRFGWLMGASLFKNVWSKTSFGSEIRKKTELNFGMEDPNAVDFSSEENTMLDGICKEYALSTEEKYAAKIYFFNDPQGQPQAVLFGTDDAQVPPEVKIDKYITNVDSISDVGDRSGKDDNTKKAEAVEVSDVPDEGINITYKVVITNATAKPVTGNYIDESNSKLAHTSGIFSADNVTIQTGGIQEYEIVCTLTSCVKGSFYENKASFTYQIEGEEPVTITSSDFVKCEEEPPPPPTPEEPYGSANIDKHITKVQHADGSGTTTYSRSGMDANGKYIDPAEVEKGDIVTYRIEFHNDFHINQSTDCDSGHYNRTWLDTVTFSDTMNDKLTYMGNVRSSHSGSVTGSSAHSFNFRWSRVDEGDTAWMEYDVKVDASNMTLMNLENYANNFVGKYVKYNCYSHEVETEDDSYTCYHHPHSNQTKVFSGNDFDYVRLLDPEIAGVVWLENGNANGLKDSGEGISTMPPEQQKVNVELWNETTGQLIATKIVEPDGSFTFGRVRKGPDYTGAQTNANGTDDYNIGIGNHFYYTSSRLYTYYLIYDYDGERYVATINSEKNNLENDYAMKPNFPNDSNAYELNRQEFNQSLETIAYNIAYDSSEPTNGKALKYAKEGSNLSVSKLYWDGNLSTDTTFNVTMKAQSFSLFFPDGETEYLKHINLGLVTREEADLSATKDVYKAEVTVNGYQTTYTYEQLDSGRYGITSSNTMENPYKLKIYREDYEFRTAHFGSLKDAVEANNPYTSDGRKNDLEIILTYKITVTNNSDTADAVVREILDYSSDTLTPLHAYVNEIAGEELTFSTGGKYNRTSYSAGGYNVRFIYGDGLNGETLSTGDSVDVFVTYKVNKDANGYIIKDTTSSLGKINVAEVGAFSLYESGSSTPIGLVDKNSNPANTKDPTKIDEYEDDTFRTSIQILLRDEDGEHDREENDYRNISGVVWEEINDSEMVDGQKVGNGYKDTNDIGAKNVVVKLYEIVTTGDQEYAVDTGLWMRTEADGRYSFGNKMSNLDANRKPVNPTNINQSTDDCYRLHAGQYVVRFIYGDEPDKLVESEGTGTTLRYSGQDYKSATYTEIGEVNEDEVLEASEFTTSTAVADGKIRSVAKDNEARRLEVNAYSTTMTYTMDKILKATNLEENKLLSANTSMFADTKKFDVQLEYYENYATDNSLGEYISRNIVTKDDHVIKFTEVTTTYYVKNVNFGLIERPITKLQLMNDITEIIAKTSDGETILDIHFDVIYERKADGTINHYTVKNEEKSTGLEHVQILNRSGYNQGFRYVNMDTDILQGMTITLKFRIAISNNSDVDHLALRTDTMVKNSKVELDVNYNGAPRTTMTRAGNIITETLSTNGTTRTYNYTNSEIYKESQELKVGMPNSIYTYDGGSKYNGAIIGTKDVSTSYTYHNLKKNNAGYYVGYYMGNVYYRGTITAPLYHPTAEDVRVETRPDQYIDYVDNDLVFKTEDNINPDGNIKYVTYTAQEIAKKGLMAGVDNTTTVITDGNQNYYDPTDYTNNNLAFNIEDISINRTLYKYLSTRDKIYQNLDESALGKDINGDGSIGGTVRSIGNPYVGNTTTYENQLDRDLYFIDLQASRTLTSEVDLDGIHLDNLAEIIKVSNTAGRKVYVITSRDGFIGNSKPEVEKINKYPTPTSIVEVASKETDTDFTEFVTFSPPTGLSQSQYEMEETMNGLLDYVTLTIASIVAISGTVYIIIQFRKNKRLYK